MTKYFHGNHVFQMFTIDGDCLYSSYMLFCDKHAFHCELDSMENTWEIEYAGLAKTANNTCYATGDVEEINIGDIFKINDSIRDMIVHVNWTVHIQMKDNFRYNPDF